MFSRKELMMVTKWDDFGTGVCKLQVEGLGRYIPFILFQEHTPKPNISVQMARAISMFVATPKGEFERMEALIVENFGKEAFCILEVHIDQENDGLEAGVAECIVQIGDKQKSIRFEEGRCIGFSE